MKRLTRQGAIGAFCKSCIFDCGAEGTWVRQVELCTSPECSLFPYRPKQSKRTRGERVNEPTSDFNTDVDVDHPLAGEDILRAARAAEKLRIDTELLARGLLDEDPRVRRGARCTKYLRRGQALFLLLIGRYVTMTQLN